MSKYPNTNETDSSLGSIGVPAHPPRTSPKHSTEAIESKGRNGKKPPEDIVTLLCIECSLSKLSKFSHLASCIACFAHRAPGTSIGGVREGQCTDRQEPGRYKDNCERKGLWSLWEVLAGSWSEAGGAVLLWPRIYPNALRVRFKGKGHMTALTGGYNE